MHKYISFFLLFLLTGIGVWFYHGKSQSPIQQVGLHTNGNVDSDGRPGNLSRPDDPSGHDIADSSISEIEAALIRLKDLSEADQKSRFSALLRRWAELDGNGAFAYVNSLAEGATKKQGIAVLLEVFARSNPQFLALLAQMALTMTNSESSTELIRGLAGIWSQTDVQSAFAWASQLPEGQDRTDALVTIRSQWAAQDPKAVSAQISQLPQDSSTAALIATVAAHWGASDPAQAIEWANGLPESQKTLAMSNLLGAWAQSNPTSAADYAVQLPPGEMQNQAVRSVVSSWAGQNPEQVAAWVVQFPAGDLRDQGISEAVNAWNNLDPDGVKNWALNLPAGTIRDIALKNFAEDITPSTPEQAAEIVASIGDSYEQAQAMEPLLRSWAETDPQSARDWLAHLNIAEGQKTRFLSFLPAN
jgi:hypothetical protein